MKKKLSKKILQQIRVAQRNEITEYHIYSRLAELSTNKHNKKTFKHIAGHELEHYNFWKKITEEEMEVNHWKVNYYIWMSKLLGITFAVRLMEKGEAYAQVSYTELSKHIPGVKKIIKEEQEHEHELINILDEKKLQYIGSIVLGLNDALIELSAALAGFTLALQNTHLIAVIGLITGIAAAMSMAASEYLSTKADESTSQAIQAAAYTGSAYLATVVALVGPFFIFESYMHALATTIAAALSVICIFNFYISVVKNQSFKKLFLEMAILNISISAISFGIGHLIKHYLGVDI